MIDFGLYATYALIGISILMILVFSVTKVAGNPGAAKTGIIGVVGLAVLIGLSFAFSSGEDASTIYADENISEGTSHYVGAALVSFYLLGALTILAILFAEVTRLFK